MIKATSFIKKKKNFIEFKYFFKNIPFFSFDFNII